ncbi:MAG: DsbA family protein, partial [Candidatus Binataceae bacterium]
YLIDQAAKKAHMTSPEYVKHVLETNAPPKITEKDAQKYYDAHKNETSRSFASVKPALITALQHRQDSQLRDQMVAKLRGDYPIGIMLTPPRVQVASAGHPSEGPAGAPVTIVEFADFQCPFCRGALDSIRAVKAKYGDKVRWVFMDFPLGIHAHAMDAANAGRCADAQHKFWPFHDALFADQSKLAPNDLKATAKRVGLNSKAFDKCLDDATYQAGIRKDMAEGSELGVTGTPTFFVNGRELVGARPPQAFDEIISDELVNAEKPQKQASAK